MFSLDFRNWKLQFLNCFSLLQTSSALMIRTSTPLIHVRKHVLNILTHWVIPTVSLDSCSRGSRAGVYRRYGHARLQQHLGDPDRNGLVWIVLRQLRRLLRPTGSWLHAEHGADELPGVASPQRTSHAVNNVCVVMLSSDFNATCHAYLRLQCKVYILFSDL